MVAKLKKRSAISSQRSAKRKKRTPSHASRITHHASRKGQALIEMIFIMPLIITMIIWLLQGVEVVKASAEHQKYLRLNLFLRLNNYAKYSVDALGTSTAGDPQPVVYTSDYMALEHNPELGRKTLAGSLAEFQRRSGASVLVRTKYGICLRPDCD